jgi:hypothetical protein
MSFLSDNSKTYLKQMEPREVEAEFWSKLSSVEETNLWRKGQSDPYTVKALKRDGERLFISVDRALEPIFKQDYQNQLVMLKFKIQDRQYFSSGTFSWNDGAGKFVVQLGSPFFVSTKRSACRYLASDFDRIQLTVAGHAFPCHDVSSGGYSSIVLKARYEGLEKGVVFEQAQLKYSVTTFSIPRVKLLAILDVPGRPDYMKVAFQFEGMKTKDEDALWVKVNASVKKLADLLE